MTKRLHLHAVPVLIIITVVVAFGVLSVLNIFQADALGRALTSRIQAEESRAEPAIQMVEKLGNNLF